MTEILDIVNENDEVIGQLDRDDPELDNHIVRTVVIGFYTPDKQLILQKRSMSKKTSPGKLTATVTGHVVSGSTYEETILKEAMEESGIQLDLKRIHFIGKVLAIPKMRAVYVYPFDGSIDDLKVEEGEADDFIVMSTATLRQERISHPEKFSPVIMNDDIGTKLLDYIDQQ